MSDKFDWQAEDDVDWDALATDEESDDLPAKRRRWPILLLILFVLAAAVGIILRQVNRRVEENTQAMRVDIISSFNLLQIADADKDDELFFSLLSGSNSSWTTAQKDLFDAGLFYDRSPFGMSAHKTRESILSAQDDALSISFSPELTEAEVVSEQPFTIDIGHSLTETVILQETAIYRQGRERWLLSPPGNDFWGTEHTQRGSRLQLSAPDRDRMLAERLLPDLERKLEEMCRTLSEIDCPPDLSIDLQFSTDPASLAALKEPIVAESEGSVLQVKLPTPTLVGLPVDETAYQALFRGYAAQLVSAVISHLVDFTCCRHAVFHQALLHHQLNQLSLKPWPVTNIDYQRILDEQLQIADIDNLWRSEDVAVLSESEGWRVYAFLDYLTETYPALSTANLQRELVRHESIYGWLDDALMEADEASTSLSSSDLIRQFWLQAYTQTFSTDQDGSAPLPAQDLSMICSIPDDSNPSNMSSHLYRYDIVEDNWTTEYSTENTLFMNPLPGDNSLMIVEYNLAERRWQTQVWNNGQVNPLLAGAEQYSISFGDTDPSGSNIIAFVFPPDGDDAIITLFDLDQCGTEGCSSRSLPSIPIWSPNGDQAIFTDEPNAQLALLQSKLRAILFDASADMPSLQLFYSNRQRLMEGEAIVSVSDLTEMGQGHAPFWLDDETVGYVGLANGRFSRPGQEIITTPVGQDNPEVLITMSELVEKLPDPASVERIFWIHYVMVHPTNPDLLFVVAMSGWDQQAHLFSYNLASRQIQHLMRNSYAADHSLSLSPNGRYQVMTGRDVTHIGINRDNALLLLHDLDNEKTTPFLIRPAEFPPFPTYDWSNDGEWLAMMLDHDLIGLFAPEHDQLMLIENAPGRCSSPAWINR